MLYLKEKCIFCMKTLQILASFLPMAIAPSSQVCIAIAPKLLPPPDAITPNFKGGGYFSSPNSTTEEINVSKCDPSLKLKPQNHTPKIPTSKIKGGNLISPIRRAGTRCTLDFSPIQDRWSRGSHTR